MSGSLRMTLMARSAWALCLILCLVFAGGFVALSLKQSVPVIVLSCVVAAGLLSAPFVTIAARRQGQR